MYLDEKECPFCFEVVKARAIKCKHCGSDLSAPASAPALMSTIAPPSSTPPADGTAPLPPSTPAFDGSFVDSEITDLLTALVSKSFVVLDAETGRFRLLETVRQYARDRLLESGEGARWREQHLAHYRSLTKEAGLQLSGPDRQAWLGRLEVEHDNLRAALEWADAVHDRESLLTLTAGLWRFWDAHGYLKEAAQEMERALRLDVPFDPGLDPILADALRGAAKIAWRLGDYSAAEEMGQQSLKIGERLEDPVIITEALLDKGDRLRSQGLNDRARGCFERALAVAREAGYAHGAAFALNGMGNVCVTAGPAARRFYEESIAILRSTGDTFKLASVVNNLGNVALSEGDTRAARSLYAEALALFRQSGNLISLPGPLLNLGRAAHREMDLSSADAHYREALLLWSQKSDAGGTLWGVEALALLAVDQGRPLHAARLWGASEAFRESTGHALTLEEKEYLPAVERARTLGGEDFDAAWAEGRQLTLEQAATMASSHHGCA